MLRVSGVVTVIVALVVTVGVVAVVVVVYYCSWECEMFILLAFEFLYKLKIYFILYNSSSGIVNSSAVVHIFLDSNFIERFK